MFRRDIIEKNCLRFCTECNNFAEDMGFVVKYTLFAEKFYSMQESCYNYFIRSGSMMGKSKSMIRLNDLNEVSYDVWKYYEKIFRKKSEKKEICRIAFLDYE